MDTGEQERAMIVAWLNAEAAKGFAVAEAAPTHSHRQRDHVAGAIAVQNAAKLIASGQHLVRENITPESQ